jgi:hypothetical protein
VNVSAVVTSFSFCESVTGVSKWHIRRLTTAGLKLGGGIDTPCLCGLVVHGWDLGVAFDESRLDDDYVSRKCAAAYRMPP